MNHWLLRITIISLFWCPEPAFSQGLDLRIYDAIHDRRNRALDEAMNSFSVSVYPLTIAVPVAQVLYGAIADDKDAYRGALVTTASLITNTFITYSGKMVINRPRPYVSHPQYTPYENDSSPAFPSGHTSYAFTTATNLTLQYRHWWVALPAYSWAAGVGYSRMHMGAHYPSDVLVGALVGAGSAWLAFKGNQWVKGKQEQRRKERLEKAAELMAD